MRAKFGSDPTAGSKILSFKFISRLGLYITKNKYELTLPSEFCRFPVKIMAAYEALKKQTKKHWPLGLARAGQWKINCGGPNWPDSLKKASGPAGT